MFDGLLANSSLPDFNVSVVDVCLLEKIQNKSNREFWSKKYIRKLNFCAPSAIYFEEAIDHLHLALDMTDLSFPLVTD